MTLYLIDKHFYPIIKPNLNAVYMLPNFFGNKNAHIFFIKSSTFSVLPVQNTDTQVRQNELTWNNYKLNFPKNIIRQINKILENIKKYKEIVFCVPNTHSYRFSIQLFLYYFKLTSVNVIFEDNFEANLMLKIVNKEYVEKEIDEIPIKKEFILRILNRLTFLFFKQKTPLTRNVSYVTLMIENTLKEKSNIIRGNTEKGEMYAYKAYSDKEKFTIKNKYMFMDILFEEVSPDPNAFNNIQDFYQDTNFTQIAYNNTKYLVKDKIKTFEFIEKCNKLEEGYLIAQNYFNFDEVNYEMENIYENSSLNEDLEILHYNYIPLKFDTKNFIDLLLNMDNETVVKELNFYFIRLEQTFNYNKFRHIIKCPNCIDGKIYENNFIYFCSNCDFRFLKQNKTIGKINKKTFVLLMKYKTLEIMVKGKLYKVRIYKTKNSGWYNLYVLQ